MKAQGDLHMINFHLRMTQIQAFRPISTEEVIPTAQHRNQFHTIGLSNSVS